MSCCKCLLMLSIACEIGFAQWEELPIQAKSHGSSALWNGKQLVSSTAYYETAGYPARPKDVPNDLVVEWSKPSIDSLHRRVAIEGTLKRGDNPVKWFQGITVRLARASDDKPDWSDGCDVVNTLQHNLVVSDQGRFRAVFKMRDISGNHTSHAVSYQIGLAFAEHTVAPSTAAFDTKVTWRATSPAVVSTVGRIEIPRAPEIAPALRSVSRACQLGSTQADIVRAVNALHSVGKKRALACLDEFLSLSEPTDHHDPIYWIIRLLFEPTELDGKIPIPRFTTSVLPQKNWPLTPVVLIFGVPFNFYSSKFPNGSSDTPERHIDWARQSGMLRKHPLKPIDPLSAVEFLIRSRKFKLLKNQHRYGVEVRLRRQAIAMLELETMPSVDGETKQQLLTRLADASLLEEPIPRKFLKKFKWNSQLNRFAPVDFAPKGKKVSR